MLKRARLLCYLVLCVSLAVLSVMLGAWSVRFAGWADWVDCRCFLSFVFLGVARRLELSPCNTTTPTTPTAAETRGTALPSPPQLGGRWLGDGGGGRSLAGATWTMTLEEAASADHTARTALSRTAFSRTASSVQHIGINSELPVCTST